MSTEPQTHWSDYWHQGHLTSLPCGFASNYDGEFLRFWHEQFAELESGDTVLDVCSGNGSIALLAQEYSQNRNLGLAIKAVDAADIDLSSITTRQPGLAAHVQEITFISNTLLEDMAEAPESADLVMSQFGVEYSNWASSAANIARVLKPGGRLSLICHSSDSTIMTQMESQCTDYAQLLAVDLFSRNLQAQEYIRSPGKFAGELNEALNTIFAIFKQRPSKMLSDIGTRLEDIHRLSAQDFDAGLHAFSHFTGGLKISYAIARDLLRVNYAMQKSPDWYHVFTEAGLALQGTGDIHYQTGEIAGIYYRFAKPVKVA